MNRRPHDEWDTGERLAGWEADEPRFDFIPYLIALIVAGCVVVGVYALGHGAQEKAPPVSEAGGASLSSTEPTKGPAS